MPPRPFAFKLTGQQGFICQSCLYRQWRTSHAALPATCRYSRLNRPAVATADRRSRQHVAPLPLPSSSAPGFNDAANDEEVNFPKPVIRYYQQEAPGKLRPLKDVEEFSNALSGADDLGEFAARLGELEAKLDETTELVDIIEAYGAKAKGRKRRAAARGSRLAAEQAAGTGPSTLPPIPLDEFPKGKRSAVHALNSCLASVERQATVEADTVLRVWRYYGAARKTLSLNWPAVPQETWDALWRVLASEAKGVDNRMHHVYVLATDMQSAGAALDGERKLLALEAMFIEGWEKEAMDNWKRLVTTLGAAEAPTAGEYWALGLRMCCLAGDLERAERAADRLFEVSPGADPRILLPLIRACAEGDATQEKAWTGYRQLRAALGASMTIEDYDEVIACFLRASRTGYALHAFVDMMFSGTVDLDDKTRLPVKVANQFFLGKWLKRLIGADDLDGAFSVLQYMENHHVIAASIQVNGLIGAWMRSGTAENQQKAEDLAWAMIRSRQVYVGLRRRQRLVEWPLVLKTQSVGSALRSAANNNDAAASKGMLKVVPRANLETFSLLADNYRSRGLYHRLEELWVAMQQAEVANGTFLTNQMIRAYTQQGQGEKARQFYERVAKEQSFKPDGDTFLELFRSLSATQLAHGERAESSRQIFAAMVEAPWAFDSMRLFDWLPKMILHTFRDAEDMVGLLVAVRAMRRLFHFVPSEALLIEMALAHTRRGAVPARDSKRLLAAHQEVERLMRQRIRERREQGKGELGELTPEQKADELALVLEEVLWTGAEVPVEDEEEFEALFASAAEEMGVYDVVVIEDADAMARKRKASQLRSGGK